MANKLNIVNSEIELTGTQPIRPFGFIFFSQIKQKTRNARERGLVFIVCGIHAREWISPATCMYMLRQVSRLEYTYSTT